MDAAAAPPPELATVIAPLSRGPPSAARPPGQRDPGGSPTLAPFDLLLQLLGNALPAGQSLPTGGSDLPASSGELAGVTATGASAAATAPTAQNAPGAQVATTLADWLRLELARAGGEPAAPTAADASPATEPKAQGGARSSAGMPAVAAAPASPDAMPIDLQALLDANADSQAGTGAQPLAALVGSQRDRFAAGDSQRRTQASFASQIADAAAAPAAADQKLADASTLRGDLPAPAAVVQIPAAVEKTVRLDDYTLPPVVAPASGVDSASAPAVPLLHTSTTHSAAASAAPPQSALPQSAGDAVDTNAARWHDALASRIQWLVDHDVGEAKIKLNPPELGALDVKIALQDDKTYVQVVAHSASARDELAQGLPRLRELLSAGGLELGGATVSGGHDDRGAFGSALPQAQPITRVGAFAAAADDVRTDLPRARLSAGAAMIDTFA